MANLADELAQHEQSLPWRISEERRGVSALRSLAVTASRRCDDIVARCGAVNNTRGATLPHPWHGCGASNSTIGRVAVNGPQVAQRYS